MTSPFLAIPPAQIIAHNALAFAFLDRYPVTPGHALVVTRRVVATFFDCTPAEQAALWELVGQVKAILDAQYRPDGYNVGFNAGEAAGQTVAHVHIHVIPRRAGDAPDPRGGIRHVLPWRGNYLLERAIGQEADPATAIITGATDPLIDHLLPLLARAREVAILVAFAQRSGVEALALALRTAAESGATVRLIAGDYLHLTAPDALLALLDLANRAPRFEPRLLRCADLSPPLPMHAKSWRIEGDGFALAWVGSSNLSRQALTGSHEWNLRLSRHENPAAYAKLCAAYDDLWRLARPLTAALIGAYAAERPPRPAGGGSPDLLLAPDAPYQSDTPNPNTNLNRTAPDLPSPPNPHEVQAEALAALAALRSEGRRRALVVLATGLGKTWLAAFDWAALGREIGRAPRLLFIAHRRELLIQAARVFGQIAPGARIGRFDGELDELGADLVFASVAKLSTARGLERLRAERFDDVVVDEVHHATARSYRRVLDGLEFGFLLGLTATPERADAGDVAALFDDAIAFRADIGRGVAAGRLVPFSYLGVRDTIDYREIPWRGGEFDLAALEQHAEAQRRMEALWAAWEAHPGGRTLLFCCSVRHAEAVRRFLAAQGVAVRCVHSGAGSDDREEALSGLSDGKIAAICAVDLFNEGIDVPTVDRVILLRPTGSPVVFLQQIGRGLRAAPEKARLQVIDFVGNHRVFLGRLRTLAEAAGASGGAALGALLSGGRVELPAGCAADLTLEAQRAMEALASVPAASLLERLYLGLRDRDGERPFAAELVALGLPLSAARGRWGGWFGFVEAQGDLSAEERAAREAHRSWLEELERTPRTKGLRLALIEAMLSGGAEAWAAGAEIGALAIRGHALLQRRPELRSALPEGLLDLSMDDPAARLRWGQYWRQHAVEDAIGKHLSLQGDRLRAFAVAPAHWEALRQLTVEILDACRQQIRRHAQGDGEFTCKVIPSGKGGDRPILMLPSPRPATLGEAGADLAARLPTGEVWGFRFVKIACNVAGPLGGGQNRLPELLRAWFGPEAGAPGTAFAVRFLQTPDGWWAEPVSDGGAGWPPPAGSEQTLSQLQSLPGMSGLTEGAAEAGGYALRWVRSAAELEGPDRMRASGIPIVLAKGAAGWRVLHTQPTEDPALVAVRGMDHACWQALGGAGASLTLPTGARERVLARLVASPLVGKTVARPSGQQAEIQSVSPQGGVRVKPTSSEARNVSLTDICWVAVSQGATPANTIDEAMVNRWRYLPGTPKGATRWIDTGWAIGIWAIV